MKFKLRADTCVFSKKLNEKAKSKTVFDFVNKHGTFNVQDTADSENKFPEISQGNPKE